jgi:hypothetical protein
MGGWLAERLRGRGRMASWTLLALLVATSAGAYVPSAVKARRARAPKRQPASTAVDVPRTVDGFATRLRQLDENEKRLIKERDAMSAENDIVHRRMVARGRAYYRMVRAGLLPVGGGFDGLVDHAARLERVRMSLARDLSHHQLLEERTRQIGDQLGRIQAERTPLRVQFEAMRRAASVMREADERRDAYARAFGAGMSQAPGTSQGAASSMAIYGASGPADTAPSYGFAAAEGRLSVPLAGRAEVRSARSPVDQGAIEMLTDRDSDVRAVFPGRVAFVGRTEHGRGVLVDHGGDYYSLYANLERVEVKVGDPVVERGRVGWVLRSGRKRAKLYFELRRGGEVLDARAWLGI